MSEKINVWRCMFMRHLYSGPFSLVMSNLSTLLSIVARGTVFWWVGYSYEDVIGPVDSFRVTHLTCNMIQKRRVVVTSSIGSSVRTISVPRPTRIASLSSSLSHCSLFATSKFVRQSRPPFFPRCMWAIPFATHSFNIHKYLDFLD